MKVPFTTNNQNNSKSINCTTINTARNPATGSPYEPKSVLELRGSPSPVTDHQKPASNSNTTSENILGPDPIQLEEDRVPIRHQHQPQLEDDWDSLMKEWDWNDDSNPPPVSRPIISHSDNTHSITHTHYSTLPEFSPVSSYDSIQFVPADFGLLSETPAYSSTTSLNELNNCNWNFGFDYDDELIRLADCFETNSLHLGPVILARLNQRLRSPVGKPRQRAAFYFKEALQSLLTGSTRMTHPSSSSEIVQTIEAQKTFSTISPISMFSSFTANQAVLDALDGSLNVHVIDFDIGLGGHWASFMKELADKADSRKAASPALRISAVVSEEYGMESTLIRDNLTQFARELNIRFDIDFVSIQTFQCISFQSVKFMEGEKVAVILSPVIFRHVGTGFMNDLRRVSPHVVVHADNEGQMGFGSSSYRQTVIDGVEFYSTLLESLEASNFNGGGGCGDWMRRIEMFVLFPKIVEEVEAAGRRMTPLREALVASGLRQVGLSQFAEFQAECLLRRVQVRGFHVVKRQAEMLLCWHDRPLVATSAWRY